MTEQDPGATFRLDQEAAQQEAETREATSWRLHVENADANTRLINAQAAALEANAGRAKSWGDLLDGLFALGATAYLVAVVWGLYLLATVVIGWFQR